MTWVEEIVAALEALGGQGSLEEIYAQIKRTTRRSLGPNWQASVRGRLEENSRDSDAFNGRRDLFRSVYGKGQGVWALRAPVSGRDRS